MIHSLGLLIQGRRDKHALIRCAFRARARVYDPQMAVGDGPGPGPRPSLGQGALLTEAPMEGYGRSTINRYIGIMQKYSMSSTHKLNTSEVSPTNACIGDSWPFGVA